MKKVDRISRRPEEQPCSARIARMAAGIGVAALLMMAGTAVAQTSTPGAEVPTPAQMTVPEGYRGHHSVDLGGRMTNLSGSEAMYDTLVNLHSGPRVLGENFEMRAIPGKKDTFADYLKAFGSGFGGDPYNLAKLDAGKGRYYQFSGLFRRDRQYFDYDLLGNPNLVGGSIPIGPSASPTGTLAWPQVTQSPVLFNTVRRMLDTNLVVAPLSTVTYRFGYFHNTMEGPTMSPSYTIFKYDALLQQYQRNGSDEYRAGFDWKPVQGTSVSLEEIVNRYKADSYFSLNPKGFQVQEADGTPAYLGNWDSQTPYGVGACNTNSMGTGNYTDSKHYTILSPAQTPGGLPVINPACAVVTSYVRSQPTRITLPTSILRFQSRSIENVTMNGDFRYTRGTLHMPSYYENVQGLNGAARSMTYQGGYAQGHRAVVAADFGAIWQATSSVSLADQVSFSSAQQPGYSNIPVPATMSTPTTAGNQNVNYAGTLNGGTAALPHGINGVLTNNYFGQQFLINNLTLSWDGLSRTTVSFTYRYGNHKIGEGVPHRGPIPSALADPVNGTVEINENGGILNVAVRPTNKWTVNGSVEALFFDNVFTPVAPRQSYQYRIRTMFKPKTWATISGAFNDRERHNNTNNNQAAVAAGDAEYYGPINHVDHNRVASAGLVLAPTEMFALDLSYAYSSVFTATNICFANGATSTLPGAATVTSTGAPNVCPGIFARGSTTQLVDFFARDFEDAPTQFGSVALAVKPNEAVHADFGYRISSVNGTRFFNDARDVSGSLVSDYQSPFVDVAWTLHPGLVWRAEYNYFGYTEGGHSGAPLCSTTVSFTASVVPCSTLPFSTGVTEPNSGLTAARNFRANNVTLGIHYEF